MGATLLVGAIAGGCAGVILAFLSHVAPRFGAGNFIQDNAHPHLFGKPISRREAHLVGLLAHLILSVLFGFIFAFFVELGWFSGFAYVPMLAFVLGLTLLTSLIIMPLEGHGLFGRKHDAWFLADALITNLLWGNVFLVLLHLWLLR